MQIITIRAHGYEAQINATRGANCIRLTAMNGEVDVLRQPDYSKPLDNPYLYGMPLLFPQNRISGGRFEFEGRAYDFGINEPATGCYIHGEIHSTPFDVIDKSENSVTLCYRSHGKYIGYKEDFSIVVAYSLDKDGLSVVADVINHSKNNMPLFFAYHTTFNMPFCHGSTEDVTVLCEVDEEIVRNMDTYLPIGKRPIEDEVSVALNSGEFVSRFPVSRHYRTHDTAKISLTDNKAGVRICYHNEGFPFRLVYNGKVDGYICLEPMSTAVDSPSSVLGREQSGFSFVPGGEAKRFLSRISVERVAH